MVLIALIRNKMLSRWWRVPFYLTCVSSLTSTTLPPRNYQARRTISRRFCSHHDVIEVGSEIESVDDGSMYSINVFETHPQTIHTAMKHTSTVDTFLAKHTVSSHTLEAFSLATDFVDRFYRDRPPLNGIKAVILDSGCGTGRSTTTIAAQNPTLPVIGIDRSIVRLSRNKDFREANDCEVGNRLLLRADLVDFFVLALDHTEWTIHSHYILYPNPYPKSKHLKRRFHGHPVLPVIMALGGYLTLRSNWFVYPKEMELALRAVTASRLTHTKFSNSDITMIPHFANSPITNFEAKYSKFRLPLYELRADLGHRMHSERIEYLRFLTQQPRS